MYRHYLAILCAIFLLFSVSANPFTAYAEKVESPMYGEKVWKNAYKEVLRIEFTEADLRGAEVRYTIWDINRDGQPELIVTTRTCDADHEAAVFSVQNGIATKIGSFSVFVGSIYGDIFGDGLYLYKGYMGSYGIDHITYDRVAGMHSDKLISKSLEDDEYAYPEITDFIYGARKLALVDISNALLMEEYKSIPDYMNGVFPKQQLLRFPNDDPGFFMKTIQNNLPVKWSRVGFRGAHDNVPFQTLLNKDFLFYEELDILKMQIADLNGDGKVECVLDLHSKTNSDVSTDVRLYLCEQNGEIHVYVAEPFDMYSYTYGNMSADRNGNLLITSQLFLGFPEERTLIRLIFDGDESFIQELPVEYYASID